MPKTGVRQPRLASGRESRLPVPFFQVLIEEDLGLHGAAATEIRSWEQTLDAPESWLFAPAHLSDRLRRLSTVERTLEYQAFLSELQNLAGAKDEPGPHETIELRLLGLLNSLVERGSCLYQLDKFPKEELRPETVKFVGLEQTEGERRLVNRLLLEDVFSTRLRRIFEIRLSEVYDQIHARERSRTPSSASTKRRCAFRAAAFGAPRSPSGFCRAWLNGSCSASSTICRPFRVGAISAAG